MLTGNQEKSFTKLSNMGCSQGYKVEGNRQEKSLPSTPLRVFRLPFTIHNGNQHSDYAVELSGLGFCLIDEQNNIIDVEELSAEQCELYNIAYAQFKLGVLKTLRRFRKDRRDFKMCKFCEKLSENGYHATMREFMPNKWMIVGVLKDNLRIVTDSEVKSEKIVVDLDINYCPWCGKLQL
ncbi:MAG: hypothetical protein Q4G33_06410 [bacterium]|nr:hypothetical protein [bacterium]